MDLTIKDQRVHLVFDTGADFSVLFRSAAEHLKLKLIEPPLGKQPASGLATNPVTEICDFAFGRVSGRIQFLVVTLSPFSETQADGVVSWDAFRSNVFEFKATKGMEISSMVPPRALEWPKFKQRNDSRKLAFDADGEDTQHRIVYVDTGDPGGVTLNHALWEKWLATRAQQPATMLSMDSMQAGVLFKKELWADEISIGSLVITNVPVCELDLKEEFDDHAATLGLYALRRLDFVLDGKNGIVYARPRGDVPPAYVHNHLGAVFDPEGSTQNAFLGHVASGSPAYLAGIRDGDVLLKVDDLDVTKRRTDPPILSRHFWEEPPGTTYKLTLKRGDREYQATVTLKSILGPSGKSAVSMSLAQLRSKAEKGEAQAQDDLGSIYLVGKYGVTIDMREAVKWFRKAAEQNEASAQYKLGMIYAVGDGVAKDGVEAAKWFRKAADQNEASAQYELGVAYANGFGVAKDDVEAVKWLRKAAKQNNVSAQSNLGYRYARGIGVKKDEVEGVIWLRKAARQNDVRAQVNLSICYAYGFGVPKDLVEACKWELLAARQGNETAKQGLTQLSNQMTRAQFQEAQRLEREFKPVSLPQAK